MRPGPPAELPEPDFTIKTFAGRPTETLCRAYAKSEEQLREFCLRKKAEGAAQLTAMLERQRPTFGGQR